MAVSFCRSQPPRIERSCCAFAPSSFLPNPPSWSSIESSLLEPQQPGASTLHSDINVCVGCLHYYTQGPIIKFASTNRGTPGSITTVQ